MIKGRPVIIKRVPPEVPQVKPKATARLSRMEQRLLGADRLQNLVNDNSMISKQPRKSILPRAFGDQEKWSH